MKDGFKENDSDDGNLHDVECSVGEWYGWWVHLIAEMLRGVKFKLQGLQASSDLHESLLSTARENMSSWRRILWLSTSSKEFTKRERQCSLWLKIGSGKVERGS